MSDNHFVGMFSTTGRVQVDAGQQGVPCLPPEGLVFDIRRYTIHDGPGIRTTVFLKGCPLSCVWCHNPEGKDPRPRVSFVSARCLGCGACAQICPTQAISLASGTPPLTDRDRCIACGRCAETCPTGARVLLGKTYSVGEVLSVVEVDRIFYDQSGGGVTFSGGEPLAQPHFLRECLLECRVRGIHTVLDTSGFADCGTLIEAAKLANLVLYDLKDIDPTRHRKTVGVPLDPILRNLRTLAEENIPVWIRIPVIPGVNTGEDTVQDYLNYLASLGARYPVSLLPYHAIGVEKYQRLGVPYQLTKTNPPSQDTLVRLVRAFEKAGFEVNIGG